MNTMTSSAARESTGAASKSADFRFTRLVDGRKQRTTSLAQAVEEPELAARTWLFVSPHDDDLCVGAGLWLQAAVRAGVDVRVLVVTDGRMGYCTAEQQNSIAAIRQGETYESFEILGVPRAKVEYIGYPDGGLTLYEGRRSAKDGEPAIVGYTGLQNAFTYHLRRAQPARVFVPSPADLHPDHQITHNELMISIFHASGAIWPELGAPLRVLPKVCELAVYCDFAHPPNLELIGSDEVFRTKLRSIEAYRSQAQIAQLVNGIRRVGPYEYLREITFRLYSPELYRPMFA